MAVSTLVRLSEDKVTRQAYQRRQDEIMLHNMRYEQLKQRAEESDRRAEQSDRRAEEAENALLEKDSIIAELRSQLDKK